MISWHAPSSVKSSSESQLSLTQNLNFLPWPWMLFLLHSSLSSFYFFSYHYFLLTHLLFIHCLSSSNTPNYLPPDGLCAFAHFFSLKFFLSDFKLVYSFSYLSVLSLNIILKDIKNFMSVPCCFLWRIISNNYIPFICEYLIYLFCQSKYLEN